MKKDDMSNLKKTSQSTNKDISITKIMTIQYRFNIFIKILTYN